MTFEGSAVPWLVVFVLVVLVVAGCCAVLWLAAAGIRLAWRWAHYEHWWPVDPPWWWKPWLYRRAEPDDETEQEQSGLCAGCWDDSEHCDGAYDTCDCTCTWPEDWADRELPPERSREELGFGLAAVALHEELTRPMGPFEREMWRDAADAAGDWPTHSFQVVSAGNLGPLGERRAPWWEAEQRQAYAALGLEFPSGLLARVREAAP